MGDFIPRLFKWFKIKNMTIYTKLLDIQKESTKLKKDANNPFFKSNYITLDNIIATYNEKLSEKWIVCYHYTKDNKLTTVLIDTEDNSKVESEFNVLNNDPQKAGSEITYGKRYNLGQLLNIQTDTDDDWNLASKAWNTKAHYPANDDLPWIGEDNIKTLKWLLAEDKTMTLKVVREKYKVSKANADILKGMWIN